MSRLNLSLNNSNLPPAVREELEQLVATIQNWANQEVGNGKWVKLKNSELQISAAGNAPASMQSLFGELGGRSTFIKYHKEGTKVTVLWRFVAQAVANTTTLYIYLPQLKIRDSGHNTSLVFNGATFVPCYTALAPSDDAGLGFGKTGSVLAILKQDFSVFLAATDYVFQGMIIAELLE